MNSSGLLSGNILQSISAQAVGGTTLIFVEPFNLVNEQVLRVNACEEGEYS